MDWAKVKGMSKEEQMRIYAATWEIAGALMEEERLRELADYDHEENKWLINDLLNLGMFHAQPRGDSGLFEQQRLFAARFGERRGSKAP